MMINKPAMLKEIVASPLPLVDSYFYDHEAPEQGRFKRSWSMLSSRRDIDRNTKLLKDDPRGSNWRVIARKTLPDLIPLYDSLVADQSGISELLNVAWAMHEITDEQIVQTFEFMKSMES